MNRRQFFKRAGAAGAGLGMAAIVGSIPHEDEPDDVVEQLPEPYREAPPWHIEKDPNFYGYRVWSDTSTDSNSASVMYVPAASVSGTPSSMPTHFIGYNTRTI